jgi:hypothetical protein
MISQNIPSGRRRVIFSLLTLCALMAVGPVLAQDGKGLTANLVRLQDGAAPVPVGRLWLSANRMRLELAALPDGYFIIDGAGPSASYVRPATNVYMDARQSSPLTRWFVPLNPAEPCRQWQAMARLAGEPDQNDFQCERIGEEIIDGRAVIVYRAVAGEQKTLGWVDPALGLAVRIKLADGTTFAVEAMTEQLVPADLLQVPARFRKFDPAALIELIKQSDVWVDAH